MFLLQKLEFTQIKSEPQPPKPVTAERLQEDLYRIYQDSDVADEVVLDYLKVCLTSAFIHSVLVAC